MKEEDIAEFCAASLTELAGEIGKEFAKHETTFVAANAVALETITSSAMKGLQYAGPVGWAASALGFDADKAAAGMFAGERETQVKTQQSMGAQLDEIRRSVEGLTRAAPALERAASALEKSAAAGPNRGNSPSPVKG